MHKGHVVIGALDRRLVVGCWPDPDIASTGRSVRKVGPGRGVVTHVGVTAKTQVADVARSFLDLGKLDVGHRRPVVQGAGDSGLLRRGQGIACLVLVVVRVAAGEKRDVWIDETVRQVRRTRAVAPGSTKQKAVELDVVAERGVPDRGVTEWTGHFSFLGERRPFLGWPLRYRAFYQNL